MDLLLMYLTLISCLVAGRLTKGELEKKRHKRNDDPIVSVPQGQIRGSRRFGENGKQYNLFRGIPYAEPPIGSLRFKLPEPARGWSGIRDCTTKYNACPQPEIITKEYIGNEDCLYLDVYVPSTKMASSLNVMVYIHGGYFSNGFNGFDGYGDDLVTEDVIVVMLQYRLGVLGFLSAGDYKIPGNFGLRDQNLALHWVKKNIEYFGGDPLKITLFGFSAGAVSVHMQILSPYGKGLFSRAILQSGNALQPFATRKDHASVARRVGTDLGCPGFTKYSIKRGANLLGCLQAAKYTKFLKLFEEYQTLEILPLLFVPRVDGDFLPAAPEVLLRQGLYNRVDIISGVTRDEGAILTKPLYASPLLQLGFQIGFIITGPLAFMIDDEERVTNRLNFPLTTPKGFISQHILRPLSHIKIAKSIFQEYIGAVTITDENADQLTMMFGDFHYSIPHDETAQLHAADGITKVYAYELHHRGPHSFYDDFDTNIGTHWVPHSEDLQFLFSNVTRYDPLVSKDDLKLKQMMLTLWTNFAKFGNPTPSPVNGVIWSAVSNEPYQQPSLDHLVLKPNPYMGQDTRCKAREFTSTIPLEQNHNLYSSIGPNAPRCYALFNRL